MSGADWIAPRLGGVFGAITRFVPFGYAAYARLCHPAEDAHGEQVSWSQVATGTKRRAHPTMHWHALIGSADPLNPSRDLWPGHDPALGTLEPGALGGLCQVLAAHTSTPQDCRFALWEGWGWIHGGPAAVVSASLDGTAPPTVPGSLPAGLSAQQLAGPRLRHSGRDYLLFQGPLDTIDQCGRHDTGISVGLQSPNLFWPRTGLGSSLPKSIWTAPSSLATPASSAPCWPRPISTHGRSSPTILWPRAPTPSTANSQLAARTLTGHTGSGICVRRLGVGMPALGGV